MRISPKRMGHTCELTNEGPPEQIEESQEYAPPQHNPESYLVEHPPPHQTRNFAEQHHEITKYFVKVSDYLDYPRMNNPEYLQEPCHNSSHNLQSRPAHDCDGEDKVSLLDNFELKPARKSTFFLHHRKY